MMMLVSFMIYLVFVVGTLSERWFVHEVWYDPTKHDSQEVEEDSEWKSVIRVSKCAYYKCWGKVCVLAYLVDVFYHIYIIIFVIKAARSIFIATAGISFIFVVWMHFEMSPLHHGFAYWIRNYTALLSWSMIKRVSFYWLYSLRYYCKSKYIMI